MRAFYDGSSIPLKGKPEDILEPPVVIHVNKFEPDASLAFSKAMSLAHQHKQPIIPIVVDSFGGSVYDLLTIVAQIKSCTIPVATIVEGKAMSAGAMLFSCGTEGYRYMAPEATLMIHEVNTASWGKITEVKNDAKEASRLNKILFHMMARNCGKKPNYFLNLLYKTKRNADWYLTSDEAKRHNLANHIKVPELKTRIKVEYEFG
jgi:ATP-dependent Clp protease protease subunit